MNGRARNGERNGTERNGTERNGTELNGRSGRPGNNRMGIISCETMQRCELEGEETILNGGELGMNALVFETNINPKLVTWCNAWALILWGTPTRNNRKLTGQSFS